MKLRELLADVDVVDTAADLDTEIDLVCCDSRQARPGAAFVAAMRVNGDGAQYIPNAVEAGASVIVSEKPVDGTGYIQVKNGAQALAQMSAALYGNPADKMVMIGVTGTKGKTTTTHMIRHILEKCCGAKCGMIGTIGNFAGDEMIAASKNTSPEAPLLHELLAKMYEKGCTHVIMEVSSHALATDRVYGINYIAAAFTNLSQDHLDYHITMENYLRAKAKLFDMAEAAAVNADDPASKLIIDTTSSEKLLFGIENGSLCAENIIHGENGGADFEIVKNGEKAAVSIASPAKFMVYNTLCAISTCVVLGVSIKDAAAAMLSFEAVPGRMESVDEGQNFRVIVDYAHSPESVKQMTETARDFTKGHLINIVGCGGNRDRTKRPIMGAAAAEHGDYVIITTDNPRFEKPEDIIADILPGLADAKCPYEVIVDRREAIEKALSMAGEGDTVLIMGKGAEDYQEVCGVRHHFDDRETAREWLHK